MASKTKLFRDNVRRQMDARGISQCELARKSNMSQPHINRILQGKNIPGLDTCERIAKVLGEPLEGLIADPT